MEVQIAVQELPYGPYQFASRFVKLNLGNVNVIERISEPRYRLIVLAEVASGSGVGTLVDVTGLPINIFLDYLDTTVVQGQEPPGDKLISRLYYKTTLGGVEYYVTPWVYLYRLVGLM